MIILILLVLKILCVFFLTYEWWVTINFASIICRERYVDIERVN